MTPSLPVPTEWIKLNGTPPPEDVWLLLFVNVDEEDDVGARLAIVPIVCGYYSSVTSQFIDTELRCINEVLEITHYSVCTTPTGGLIGVVRG